MTRLFRTWPALALGLTLAACGGGGGDAGLPLGQADVAAAVRSLNSAAHSWTVTATVGTDAYRVVFDLVPDGASTFPKSGAASVVSKQTVALSKNGIGDSSVTDLHFDPNSFALLGTASGTACAVTTAAGPLPSAAASGDSGLLYSIDSYDGCTDTATRLGSVQVRWSLELDSGVLLFCRNAITTNAAGAEQGRENDCASVTGNGSLGTQARITISAPGSATLTLRNF